MKTYEITFITKEDTKEASVKTVLDNLGGKILTVSSLGQKTFAYRIKKENKGFYTTVNFEIEPEKLTDFNKKLSLTDEILRFLIVIVSPTKSAAPMPTKEKTAEKPKDQTKTEVIEEAAVETEEKPAEKLEKVEKPAKIKEEKPAEKTKKPAKKPKKITKEPEESISEEERMEALDKKLEELLKE